MATTHVNAVTSADVVTTRIVMEDDRAGRTDRIIKRVSQLAGYSVLAAAYILIMLILF